MTALYGHGVVTSLANRVTEQIQTKINSTYVKAVLSITSVKIKINFIMKKNISLLALVTILSCKLITAQNFVTQWNLATAGSGATQLSIRTVTSGTVNYTWQQIPSGASGSGSWSGTPLTITGLPAGATIRLQIAPANFQRIFINYDADRNRLTQIEQWGSTAWASMANAFQGCTNLQVTATDVPDLSGVNSLSQMFEGCTNLNSPANINTWNTAAVINMSYMFAFTSAFNQNIGSWNTAAVTNMQGMFFQATAFNQPIGLWNTAAVTNMFLMFYQASAFNQNIGSWNTAAVTDMSSMFNRASAFNQNIGSFNTTAVTDMSFMFFGASAFNNGGNNSINNWNTGDVTTMSQMFTEASVFNQNIGSWNTTAVTNMSGMFQGASAFNNGGNNSINNWNTGAVTNMSLMFSQASAFNQNIGSWNTTAVTDMAFMFSQASVFNQNIGAWNTAEVTNMQQMFQQASAFNQNIGAWNTAAVNNMLLMFNSAGAFNQNIGAWNTAAVTDMLGMFSSAIAFNQNIGSWTLNPGVDLSNMLDNSGMDCINYSATLIGWSTNPSTPDSRNLGASIMEYGTNAEAARTNLTGAKGWTITGDAPSGSSCSVILPVTWLYINGQWQNNAAQIKWGTASETNTKYFEIEHSSNGISYSKVGTVAAAGNSSLTERYEFLHTSPTLGKNYYRIKQIDLDGRFTYSTIIVLQKSDLLTNTLIAPNPVHNETTVYFGEEGSKTLQLINLNGNILRTDNIGPSINRYTIKLDKLSPGLYLLRLQTTNETTTHKIIKQ